jgi:hypothetical protein
MFTLKNILLTLLFIVFIGILYKYFSKPVEPMTVSELTKQFQGFQTMDKDKQAMDTYCFSATKGVCRRRGALSNDPNARYLIGKSLKLNWPEKNTEYEIIAVITGNPYGSTPIGTQQKGTDIYDVITNQARWSAKLNALKVGYIYASNHFAYGKKDIISSVLSKQSSGINSILTFHGQSQVLLSDHVNNKIIKKLPDGTPLKKQLQSSYTNLKKTNDAINNFELKKNMSSADKKVLTKLKFQRAGEMVIQKNNIGKGIEVLEEGDWKLDPNKKANFYKKFKKLAKKEIKYEARINKKKGKISKKPEKKRLKAEIKLKKKIGKRERKFEVKRTKIEVRKKKFEANKLQKAQRSEARAASRAAQRAASRGTVRGAVRVGAGRTAKLLKVGLKYSTRFAKVLGKFAISAMTGPVAIVIGAAMTVWDVWDAFKNDILLMKSGDYCSRTKGTASTKDAELLNTLITEIRFKRKFQTLKQFLIEKGTQINNISDSEKKKLYREHHETIKKQLKIANDKKFKGRKTPTENLYKNGVIEENTRYTMYLNNFDQILNYLVPYKYMVNVDRKEPLANDKKKIINPNYTYLRDPKNRRHLDNVMHCTWDTLTQRYSDTGMVKGSTMNIYNMGLSAGAANTEVKVKQAIKEFITGEDKNMDQWDDKIYNGKYLKYMDGERFVDKLNRKVARKTLLQLMSQELLSVLAKNRSIYDSKSKVLRLLNESGVDDGRCYYHLYDAVDEDGRGGELLTPNIWCPEFTNISAKDENPQKISRANLREKNLNKWKNGRKIPDVIKKWDKIGKNWGVPYSETDYDYLPAKFSNYSSGDLYAPQQEQKDLIDNNKKFNYLGIKTEKDLQNGWKKNNHRKILKYYYNPISVFMPSMIKYNKEVKSLIKKRLKGKLNEEEGLFLENLTYLMPIQGNNHENMLDKKEKYRWDVVESTFLKKPTRMSCAPYITNVTKPNIDWEDPLGDNYKDGTGNNPSSTYISKSDNEDYDDIATPVNGRPKNTNNLMWPPYYITKEGEGMYRCMKRDLDSVSEKGKKNWETGNPRTTKNMWKEVDEKISNAPLITSMYTYSLYTYTYKVDSNGKLVSDEECVFGNIDDKDATPNKEGMYPVKLENTMDDNEHIDMVDVQLQIKELLFDSYEKSSEEYDKMMTCKFTDKAKANKSTCVPKQRVKCAGFKNNKTGKEKISKQFDNFKKKKTKIETPEDYKDTLNFLKCYRKVLHGLDKTEVKHLPNINEHDYLTQALIDYASSPSRIKDNKYCKEVKKQMSTSNNSSYTLNTKSVEAQADKLSKIEGDKLRDNLYNCNKEIGKFINEIY